MKKSTLLLLVSFLLFGNANLKAQNWVNGGNSLTANGSIGTKTNYSLLFETYNIERGRITNTGLWGIGTTSPNAKLHINSTTSQEPFRVQVNKTTKLLVNRNGGVSIGFGPTPPANGLLVNGNVTIGTTYLSVPDKLNVVNSSTHIYSTGISGSGNYSGVTGYSSEGQAIYGLSTTGYGGYFYSEGNAALYAHTDYGEYAAIFNGGTFNYGTYETSDKNLKKDIQEMGNAMSIISKLKPKHYQFRDDGKYAALHLPKGSHFGLIAQDVEEVLPELVKESTHEIKNNQPLLAIHSPAGKSSPALPEQTETKENINIKALNYTGLIPIVIKALQEQNATLQQQKQEMETSLARQDAKIEELKQLVIKLSQNPNIISTITDSYLSYSSPNPSNTIAKINYNLPPNTAKAELLITNAAGQKIKQIQLNRTGLVDIDTSELPTGTYFYSLYLDGNLADSKKMMVYK